MYFPISGVTVEPWVLILIGFVVGVCGGFFGIGGAFLVTPALNIFGFPMAYAIGTDLAHITGKSVISTLRRKKLGNLDGRAGILLILGTIPGIEVGARVVMWLEHMRATETVVRSVYIGLLVIIGTAMRREWLWATKQAKGNGTATPARGRLAEKLHSLRLKPLVSLPASGIQSISVWLVIGIAFATGFCAGLLGVGGGFISVPAMLYLVGMPTKIAIGTGLLQVLFSGGYGSFTYALKGWVDIHAALIMLLGAAVGSQIGATATDHVKGYRIRLYFALTVLIGAVAVTLKQVGYGRIAAVVLLASGSAMSLAIILALVAGLMSERREKRPTETLQLGEGDAIGH